MPFEVADITVSALGGDVSITDYLYLLNTDVDLNGQNLYIPDAGILDLDNSSISDAMVFGDDFSTINGSNDAWLSGSTFNSVFISGSIDTRVNTYVDCVLDGLLQNDDYSVHPTVVFEGNFTNDGSIINRPSYNYDLYANIFGHVYNYGTWEIDECRWQGSSDQDIYLMEASEINTPSEFQAMIGTTGFQWYKNDILIGGATTYHLDFTSITAAERGYYHCVTNEGSSRTITVCTPLDIDLDAEAWFCQYESVMLDPQVSAGQGPYTYSWFPVEGLSDPNIQNPLASPTEPTVYKVIITDAIGCEGESDIFVQQYPQLNASAGNDKEICYGFSTSLNGSTWGGEPDYTYEWSPATGLSNPNIANPTASPFSTTFYTLTVTDANGCVETSDASVTVNVLPEAYGLSQDSTHFCYGNDTIICWLLDSQVGVDYHLQVNGVPNPGGEVFAGTGETIPIWATTTVQGHYTLKGINTTTGCQKIMTGSVMIFIDFLPEVVDQSGDEIVLLGDNTTLWVDVTSTQPPWLQWYKDGEMIDGANDHQLQITDANFDDTGEYFCIVTNNCDVTLSEPLVILVLERQTIEIPAGWSGYSTYLDVHDPDLPVMFDQLAGNMVIVSDFNSMYWPSGGINTYLDWVTQRGSQIKLTETETFSVDGMFTGDNTLVLAEGWHYLPVLSESTVDASDLFTQAGVDLAIAKDIAGTRVYWPGYGIYTLDVLDPGSAYLIKLNSACEIDFGLSLKNMKFKRTPKQSENKSSWNTPVYTPESHLIALPENVAQQVLKLGDFVGVFTYNNTCTGLQEYTGGSLAITAFGDDITTSEQDGFTAGDAMTLKIYRSESKELFETEVVFDTETGNGNWYTANGISVISMLKAVPASNKNPFSTTLYIYPNPSDGMIHISGIIPGTTVEVLDAMGKTVYQTTLTGESTINLTSQPSGLYNLRITSGDQTTQKKIVIK